MRSSMIPPSVLAQHRVLGLPDRQRAGIADECVAQEGDAPRRRAPRSRPCATGRTARRRSAHGAVLLDDRGVLDRHLVPGEGDHPRPEGNVLGRGAACGAAAPTALAHASSACRRPSPHRASGGLLDDRALGGMREEREGLVELDPADLVELGVVGVDAAAHRAHEEEVDGLVEAGRAADEEVADGPQRSLDLDLEAGLLPRLAQRQSPRASRRRRACPSAAPTAAARARWTRATSMRPSSGSVDDTAGRRGTRGPQDRHAARR